MPLAKKCQKLFTANSGGTKNTKRRNGLSFNLVTYGGRGGGLFGPDHQIIGNNSKAAQSSTSKLGDF